MANDRQPSVLIVDDHDGFRAFARKLLEAAGFAVAEAASGVEATKVAGRVGPRWSCSISSFPTSTASRWPAS